MAQRAIREYDGKSILHRNWNKYFGDKFEYPFESVLVTSGNELKEVSSNASWLNNKPLVAKPDMLFGKRGVNNLVLYKVSSPGDVKLSDASSWIDEKGRGTTSLKSGQSGVLTHFLVEPFIPHEQDEEYYISASTGDEADFLYMSAHGGIDIEEDWEDKVIELRIEPGIKESELETLIKNAIPSDIKDKANYGEFAVRFYKLFADMHFAYLEINPIVIKNNKIFVLDMVAKLDDTAAFLKSGEWGGEIEFPTAFGMEDQSPEEKAISEADAKSGASLKLTILNPKGRIWTMVAGGGASVVYADTIADFAGDVNDLANYGEYSGGPTTGETKFYAETVLDLMTRHKDEQGRDKILIIGGAIANFTDVAKTFTGIIQAFENYADKLKEHNTKIYVRRGGPNFEKGLKDIKEAAGRLGLYIEVYGPETHVTDIVRMALEKKSA